MDINEIKASLARRINIRQSGYHKLWQQGRRDFDAIVDMIKTDYNPTRIYCWGSLLDKTKFNTNSDIDIGVEGVSDPEKYFELLDKASGLTNLPVDIVQMEKIDPIFNGTIKRKGIIVYEREN